MSAQALIIRNDSDRSIAFTDLARQLKNTALESAALIGRVSNAEEQEKAVAAQKELTRVLTDVEKARKACKEPVLDFGRKIDDTAKAFSEELKPEQMRIARLVGDFQQLEQEKARAAAKLESDRLAGIERERQAELAKARSHEELDKINERHNNRAAQEAPKVFVPPKVQGQAIREDWEVTVTDIWALARAYPMCVKVEPMLSQIKPLLDGGIKLPGVLAVRKTNATVRLGREPKAIEV